MAFKPATALGVSAANWLGLKALSWSAVNPAICAAFNAAIDVVVKFEMAATGIAEIADGVLLVSMVGTVVTTLGVPVTLPFKTGVTGDLIVELGLKVVLPLADPTATVPKLLVRLPPPTVTLLPPKLKLPPATILAVLLTLVPVIDKLLLDVTLLA